MYPVVFVGVVLEYELVVVEGGAYVVDVSVCEREVLLVVFDWYAYVCGFSEEVL